MDRTEVMSGLEGLTWDDWEDWHSATEVREIAQAALELLQREKTMSKTNTTPKEDTEQMHVFRWAALEQHVHPELALLYAIPNGGYRNKVTAALMKATGVKAGVPDMFLPVPRGKYHGLYIELKRKEGGQVSVLQKQWIVSLTDQGYMARVCRGADEAIDVIKSYLDPQERREGENQK